MKSSFRAEQVRASAFICGLDSGSSEPLGEVDQWLFGQRHCPRASLSVLVTCMSSRAIQGFGHVERSWRCPPLNEGRVALWRPCLSLVCTRR
ncbi:hypothetical protein EJ04DRAFT_336789 [Polyplosphaeria fusca]|uniref:Uncharacterized protein n=1 Tax=Polyplosphaeria fusca TaxID=682080 RepID=A0A9P4QWK9_9PLEO|nr:hypothetical protein EJ04DRAFT_336789 [Polyplosphaeria fusca]